MGDMGGEFLFTLIATLGGLSGITTFILVFPQIRKLRADAKKVSAETDHTELDAAGLLSQASLNQMQAAIKRAEDAEGDTRAARTERDEAWNQLENGRREKREAVQLLHSHREWDDARMRENPDNPTPPPLPYIGS